MGVTVESAYRSQFNAVRIGQRQITIASNGLNALFLQRGMGYLAGEGPDHATRIEGVPGPAQVRVLLRSDMPALDGLLIAQTVSGIDGSWRIEGLDMALKYDVVCRVEGYNDMILSGVSPKPMT